MESISAIIHRLSKGLPAVDLGLIAKDISAAEKVVITSSESREQYISVLEQLSQSCSDKTFTDPQWGMLSGRLLMEIIHFTTPFTFLEATIKMKPILHPDYYDFVIKNGEVLSFMINKEQDYSFDLFSVSTLRKSYLAHVKTGSTSALVETPQYMYLRVATFIHYPNLEKIKETYVNLSNGNYAHASPTLFNAGMSKPQMASCFLMDIKDDTGSIYKSWKDQATISMNSGGLGIDYSQLRHSEIGQHGYVSGGIVPWIKVTNEILKTVNQGHRKGSGTIYLRDFHVDIYEFIELRDEGPEDMRAKDLFLALMVSDLFMSRVQKDQMWSLFCPNKAKGLFDKWGVEFEKDYEEFERKHLYSRQIRARDLWQNILNMQIKKGMPFLLYIDACNRKSNQKNSGMIRCSNLCTEILEVTNPNEIASCNLASISINKCVETDDKGAAYFSFEKLGYLARELVQNLNHVVDRNFYPSDVPEIKYSNMRHRPLGIGIQGLADAFALLDIAWVTPNEKGDLVLSEKARRLNKQIFEVIYYHSVRASVDLAKIYGSYDSFKGSPASKGEFQFDMWDQERMTTEYKEYAFYPTDVWDRLRKKMIKHGMRNSLLIALMPTASSAHILGNNECFEPFNELMYARTVLSGQFVVVNKHLVKDLRELGLWNTTTVRNIIDNRGSMQRLPPPEDPSKLERFNYLKLKYLTVFEIPQQATLQMSVDRARFICQTQSQNCFMAKPTKTKLNAYHFYGWQRGIKTGMYYLRQKATTDPINVSASTMAVEIKKEQKMVCTDEVCIVCQS